MRAEDCNGVVCFTSLWVKPTATLNTAEWADISGGTRGPLMGCLGARFTHSRCNNYRFVRSRFHRSLRVLYSVPRRDDVPSRLQPDGDRRYQAVLVTGARRLRRKKKKTTRNKTCVSAYPTGPSQNPPT